MKLTIIGAIVVIGIAVVAGALLIKQRRQTRPVATTQFSMPIDDTFALKTEGETVVVGIITSGTLTPGDKLFVRTQSELLPVTVLGIEAFHKPLTSAKAGDRVGIKLHGIRKEQIELPAILESHINGT